jgi:hypothetical protein
MNTARFVQWTPNFALTVPMSAGWDQNVNLPHVRANQTQTVW